MRMPDTEILSLRGATPESARVFGPGRNSQELTALRADVALPACVRRDSDPSPPWRRARELDGRQTRVSSSFVSCFRSS